MDSVHKNPDPRDYRYLQLVTGRLEGVGDARTAQVLGFDSARELYKQIFDDGHPMCPVCGEAYVPAPAKHCTSFEGRERRPKSWDDATKLPPAEDAAELLRKPLTKLLEELDKLRGREEHLQNKRFVGVRRDGERRMMLGASSSPPEPLTTLIAVFALVEGSRSMFLWRFLGKLHPSKPVTHDTGRLRIRRPDADQVDLRKLDLKIRELRLAAEQVARIVRGGEVKQGPGSGELPAREHSVLDAVKAWHGDGDSDEEIARLINAVYRFKDLEKPFTVEEVRRIRESGASPPK
jgi:hypothetical protein